MEKTNNKKKRMRRRGRGKSALAVGETSPVGKDGGAEITGSAVAQTACDLEGQECLFA